MSNMYVYVTYGRVFDEKEFFEIIIYPETNEKLYFVTNFVDKIETNINSKKIYDIEFVKQNIKDPTSIRSIITFLYALFDQYFMKHSIVYIRIESFSVTYTDDIRFKTIKSDEYFSYDIARGVILKKFYDNYNVYDDNFKVDR